MSIDHCSIDTAQFFLPYFIKCHLLPISGFIRLFIFKNSRIKFRFTLIHFAFIYLDLSKKFVLNFNKLLNI